MTTITVEHVSKTFPPANIGAKPVPAIQDVSLKIQKGDIIALLGPSGSGKSTLLRLIAGLFKPDSGRVLYDHTDLQQIPIEERGIGMVFQEYALIPHWRAEQNIGFFMRLRRRESEVPERVKRISKITGIGLEYLMGRFPSQLSGGEKQRVSIARALTRDLSLLLLDEPFANLDAKFRAEARVELKRLLQEFNVTTVYVTHDQVEATALARRMAILNRGQMEQIGTYNQLYNSPINLFVAEFLGTPKMNLFKGHVEDGQWVGENFGPYPIRSDLSDGTRVTLGIRPEYMHLKEGGIPAVVDSITPFYAERYQLLEVWLGSDKWQMNVPLDTKIEPGSTVYCDLDLAEALYFDSKSGRRIG